MDHQGSALPNFLGISSSELHGLDHGSVAFIASEIFLADNAALVVQAMDSKSDLLVHRTIPRVMCVKLRIPA